MEARRQKNPKNKKQKTKQKKKTEKTVGKTSSSESLAPKYLRCHREKKQCLPKFSSLPFLLGKKYT